jgi:hypothetical protein
MSKKTQKEIMEENIIELLGLQALPYEKKTRLLEQMSNLIQQRIMLRIMDQLKDEDKDKMAEIEKDFEKIANFLAEKVPNLEDIIKDEVLKVKKELYENLPEEK